MADTDSNTAPLSPKILAALRCPKCQEPLHLVNAAETEAKQWTDKEPKAEAFLVTQGSRFAYPVIDGYPYLLLDRVLENESIS